MRVLIVEDNEDASDFLSILVTGWGHEVVVAPTGGAALEQVRVHDPDAVLLDLALPDLSGWKVAANVQRQGSPRRPLMVAVSAFNPDPERAAVLGIDAQLTKPPNIDELRDLLAVFSRELAAAQPT